MNLEALILKEHSKENCTRIVNWVGANQNRFDELFELFLNGQNRVKQCAAWPVSFCAMNHPQLIQKHFSRLFKNLKKPALHDAVKRNSIRLLQEIKVPEKFHGDLLSICFDLVSSATEKPATKAFSLTVLGKLSSIYPDIKQELKTIIETQWEFESAAFKSRARKIIHSG